MDQRLLIADPGLPNPLVSCEKADCGLGDVLIGKHRVFKSMTAEDDLTAAGQSIHRMEDVIPAILRHQRNQRIQTYDILYVDLFQNLNVDCIG